MHEIPPTEDTTDSPRGVGLECEGHTDSESAEPVGWSPTRAELHALNAELAQEFPVAIDTTELVLMDVDPARLHAFWSVMPADLEAIGQAPDPGPAAALVLRLHDVTPARFGHIDRARSVDFNVGGLQGSRYIEHLESGKSYIAELGCVGSGGVLHVLAESNTLLMPGVAPPLTTGQRAAAIRDRPGLPNPQPLDAPAGVRRTDLEPVFPNAGEKEPWRSLSLVPIGSEAEMRPTPDPVVETPGPATGRPTASGQAFDLPLKHPLQELTGDGSPHGWRPGLTPELGSGSILGGGSSSDVARPAADLEMSVELLIHGRTRPGSRLSLFGRPIVLGPDGSFSIRQPLPDGILPLALVLGRDDSADNGES